MTSTVAFADARSTQPNRFIVELYLGAAFLAVGVASLGIGLLTG